MPSSRLLAFALLAGTACAGPPAPALVAPVAPIAEAAPPAPPSATAAPEEPLPPREEALARGQELAAAKNASRWYDDEQRAAWLRERRFDEATLRRTLASVAGPCLARRERDACAELQNSQTDLGHTTDALLVVLAEIADPAPLGGASLRLLVRLDARGAWSAGGAVTRILERRMLASPGACAPPSAAEIEAARRSLADFAVRAPGTIMGPAARWPTAAELDELAYFTVSIEGAGPEVGRALEDQTSKPLPAGHPDLAVRAGLRDELRAALLDGDLDRHLRAADAYLRTLGYPDPLRLAEEGDERWGGAGAAFLMRDEARSAEILGRYELAEALYRRANPGGGWCGTTTPSRRADQIHGVLRVVEQRRGCRAAAVERLFAVPRGVHHAYELGRLTRAGFDVPRLYAGAIHTLGRDDAAELERALGSLPDRAGEAVARLRRVGTEAWATRVRAVPGYADTARGGGLGRLLDLADRGPGDAREAALEAVGRLLEERGYDPCIPSRFGFGSHSSSSRLEREVDSVMGTCATRLDAKTVEGVVRRVADLATDPEPGVREAAAVALGRLGSPRAQKTLEQLAHDRFDAGGQVCTSKNSGPSVCGPNLPVALAAREALDALAAAAATRVKQRTSPRRD